MATHKIHRAMRDKPSVFRSLWIGFIWLAVIGGVGMLAWVLIQSFRPTREILAKPFGLPRGLDFSNWVTAWTQGNFASAAWNSVWVTLVSSVLTIVVAVPAAYYLGRVETRLTRGITMYFILGIGVPVQVILIPLFVILNQVNMIDSLIGLNLVYIAISMPFTVFLLAAFFRSLPSEVEESAALDGANTITTLVRISLPLARGGILTAFVLQVIAHWNETLLALTLMQSPEHYTLPVALIEFINQQIYTGADYGGTFAGICLIVLPMLLIYLWIGTRLSEGLTVGIGK